MADQKLVAIHYFLLQKKFSYNTQAFCKFLKNYFFGTLPLLFLQAWFFSNIYLNFQKQSSKN